MADTAVCRGCGRELRGKPYHLGGLAYLPLEMGGGQAKRNFYGGWVCSRQCDFNSSLRLEQTMPGHGYDQTRLGSFAQQHFDSNWSNHE